MRWKKSDSWLTLENWLQVLSTVEESRKTSGYKDMILIPQLFGKSSVYLQNNAVYTSLILWTHYAFLHALKD